MKYSARIQEIINVFYEAHLDLARGNEDQRRELAKIIAEQVAFENGPEWGSKKSAEGHPLSKDTIAFKSDLVFVCWDMFNGTTRAPNQYPEAIDIRGQVFVPVFPFDHLMHVGVEIITEPKPLGKASIEDILVAIAELRKSVEKRPNYTTSYGPITVTSEPVDGNKQ